jgi:hypothetical protein
VVNSDMDLSSCNYGEYSILGRLILYRPSLLILMPGCTFSMAKYLSSIRQFFKQILNLEYKVKVDVYSYMFMCDFFNFLVVIFGFASFGVSKMKLSTVSLKV